MSVPSNTFEIPASLKRFQSDAVHYQLSPEELMEQTLLLQQGRLNDTEALCIDTGKFTGRSPDDKFIVQDELTAESVNWGKHNHPIEEKYFLRLREKMMDYLSGLDELWVRDAYACADPQYRLKLRVTNEHPWSNLFVYNMFLRPEEEELENFEPEWTIYQAPGFKADPQTDGTRSENFAVISFRYKTILIGGTGYTGEIKKAIFTVLNFLLPNNHHVLSMHCSANIGKNDDVALFFGLSGTGKTTLSADPARRLIGDDEHGWDDAGVFNFEGGCYAKCVGLTAEHEPQIFNAIRHGALVENVRFEEGTNRIDFDNTSVTENTRVSYPLHFIPNVAVPAAGGHPKHIFFLTCDANGVLPPVSKLSPAQAMYQFISGYTAKIAGTEAGITEPKLTFSACFGAPFMPLHPGKYAKLLGEKIREDEVKVWLINTGWIGGPYGIGNRIKLSYTRAMITAALNGELDNVPYETHPLFGFKMPQRCPGVPFNILNPRFTWHDRQAYDERALALAKEFVRNFSQYAGGVSAEVLAAAPKI
jgi:phosphoenolpyruvate carboxykinase (ATP)